MAPSFVKWFYLTPWSDGNYFYWPKIVQSNISVIKTASRRVKKWLTDRVIHRFCGQLLSPFHLDFWWIDEKTVLGFKKRRLWFSEYGFRCKTTQSDISQETTARISDPLVGFYFEIGLNLTIGRGTSLYRWKPTGGNKRSCLSVRWNDLLAIRTWVDEWLFSTWQGQSAVYRWDRFRDVSQRG